MTTGGSRLDESAAWTGGRYCASRAAHSFPRLEGSQALIGQHRQCAWPTAHPRARGTRPPAGEDLPTGGDEVGQPSPPFLSGGARPRWHPAAARFENRPRGEAHGARHPHSHPHPQPTLCAAVETPAPPPPLPLPHRICAHLARSLPRSPPAAAAGGRSSNPRAGFAPLAHRRARQIPRVAVGVPPLHPCAPDECLRRSSITPPAHQPPRSVAVTQLAHFRHPSHPSPLPPFPLAVIPPRPLGGHSSTSPWRSSPLAASSALCTCLSSSPSPLPPPPSCPRTLLPQWLPAPFVGASLPNCRAPPPLPPPHWRRPLLPQRRRRRRRQWVCCCRAPSAASPIGRPRRRRRRPLTGSSPPPHRAPTRRRRR